MSLGLKLNASGNAAAEIAELEAALNGIRQAGTNTESALLSGAKALQTFEKRLDDSAKAHKKANDAIESGLDKFSEWGASVEQQKNYLQALIQVQNQTGLSLSYLSRSAEELIDSTQNADLSIKNLGESIKFLQTANVEATEGMGQYADLLAGRSTDALDNFGQVGSDLSDILDTIQDRALRAETAQKLLNARMNASQPITQKVTDRLKVFSAQMVNAAGGLGQLQLVGGIAGGALLAAAGAVAKLATDGVSKFLEQNVKAKKSVDELTEAYDTVLYNIGGAILGWDKSSENIDKVSNSIEELGGWIKNNSELVNSWVRLFAKGMLNIGRGIVEVISGVAMVAAGIDEIIRGVFGNLLSYWFYILEAIIDGLYSVGLVSEEAALGISELRAEVDQFANVENAFQFDNVEAIAGFLERVREFHGEAEAIVDGLASGKPSKAGRRDTGKGGAGAAKPISAAQAGFDGGFEQIQIQAGIQLGGLQLALQENKALNAGFRETIATANDLSAELAGLDGANAWLRKSAEMRIASAGFADKLRQVQAEAKRLENSSFALTEADRERLEVLSEEEIRLENQILLYERLAGSIAQSAAELESMEQKSKAAQKEGENYGAIIDSVASSLGGLADETFRALGASLAGAEGFSNFGETLLSSFDSLISTIVPILTQLAISLIGVETGNAFLILGAAALLSILAGTLQGAFADKPTSRASASANDGLRSRLLDKADNETTINLEINVGNEKLEKAAIKATRGAIQRKALPGRGSLMLGRG